MFYEFINWYEESCVYVDSCYIGDWFFIGKIVVWGLEVLVFFLCFGMNNFVKFEIGQIKYYV